MKMKKERKYALIAMVAILGIVGVAVVVYPQLPTNVNLNDDGSVSLNSFTMYCADINGNAIPCLKTGLQSIIGGQPVYYIAWDIGLTNAGGIGIDDATITMASPIEFENAIAEPLTLAETKTNIPAGNSVTWVTYQGCQSDADCESSEKCIAGLESIEGDECWIMTTPLETYAQPVTFLVEITSTFTCPAGKICTLPDSSQIGGQPEPEIGTWVKQGSAQLNIQPDEEIAFAVNIDIISAS